MNREIKRLIVVGGGSAGFMAALSFAKRLPGVQVVVVHSPNIPVIGVGESTTRAMPQFLHSELGIDQREFFRAVEPSFKLGLRLEFGVPEISHFNYPFDLQIGVLVPGTATTLGYQMLADPADASYFCALMDRDKSPCRMQQGHFQIDPRSAYHIKNDKYIAYLERKSVEAGATTIEGEVAQVLRDGESGDVTALKLVDGREVAGDFFVDCSGFRSLLLGKTLGTRFVSYARSLLCDRAIVGQWNRTDDVCPYTTCTTMNHGWCWKIEFHDLVTRGYVHSSAFCSPEEAMREMKEKNPQLGDDLRAINFPSGRYEDFWVGNVAGIGNASGFVEPLEATALHMIIEQTHFLGWALLDGGMRINPAMRDLENDRFRRMWDDIRDFLAIHYRFNHKIDTPFWRHCHEAVDLAGAAAVIEYYRAAGPSALAARILEPQSIFEVHGYMTLLLGQHVPTTVSPPNSPRDVAAWKRLRDRFRAEADAAMTMRDALNYLIFGR